MAVVVAPDGGGEGEEALEDSDEDALLGVAAVEFQVELGFQGGIDGFDDLAQRFEEPGAVSGWARSTGRCTVPVMMTGLSL